MAPARHVDKMASVVVALALACPLWAPTPASAGGRLSPAGVLALAEQGLTGGYQATYALSGQLAVFPGPKWRVVVAHRGRVAQPHPSATGDATWSFFLHAGDGYRLQWIEEGQHFLDCWTMPARPGWHCGQGTYETSNGFSLATLPYIPESVVLDLGAVLGGRAGQHVSLSRGTSRLFGPLTCLTAVSNAPASRATGTTSRHPFVTTCLTARGLVASQHQWGEGTWDNVALLGWRQPAPASDFHPVSVVGRSPFLPPL